ncbi:hypothetical protein ACFVS2_20925 [Brevibacillus sp. NPDC058079]|uniref:hypothetical protein n=1 Tax=Brevibacillus sp. NPDC058079 TaxID=3346330 RepID=UPI0036F0F7E7
MTNPDANKVKYKKEWDHKLKRIDAVHKACLIRNEVDNRIDKLTSIIPDLDAQGKTNEHMIAVHRRSELEDMKKWIQDTIFDAKELGTKEPLKIWDVLKYGEHGEVYRATNTVETWNGCEVQVTKTHDGDPHPILVYAKVPKVSNSRMKVSGTVNFVGAVTRADWVFVGKRAEVKEPSRGILVSMCLEMGRVLRFLTDQSIYMGQHPQVRIRLELEKSIERVLNVMDKHPGDFLATDIHHPGDPPELKQLRFYQSELRITQSDIAYLNDDELAQKIEEIISLTYYMYRTWWGIWEWDDRIEIKLTNEDMLKIAKLKIA